MVEGRENLQGKINASVWLKGSGPTRNGMIGGGSVRLSDAYVYELPAMVAMLKYLSFRAPDRNAFSNIAIDYRIEGEYIYFNPIDFKGDAISLLGQGEMDWQSNLNVNFRAVVGRAEPQIPIIKDLFSGASRGAMLIRVSGTLQKPDISREVLPGVQRSVCSRCRRGRSSGEWRVERGEWRGHRIRFQNLRFRISNFQYLNPEPHPLIPFLP